MTSKFKLMIKKSNLFNYYKDKTIIYVSHKNEISNNFNKVITIGEEDGRRIN